MAAMNVAQLRAMDDAYTRLILRNGEELTQSIASGTLTPNGTNNTITVPMRAVGLCRGFIVKVTASFTNTAANAAAFTNIGAANLISNFTLTDLDNYQRINTAGYHMNALNTAKEGFPFGAALLSTAMDSPVKYGNNMSVIAGTVPAISSGTAGTITMYYYVPLAYGKHDLRGALFTGVTNATGYLAFTFNPTPYVAKTGADPTLAVYTDNVGGSAAVIVQGACTYNVYQCYIDQLPKYTSGAAAGAPILPPLSIRTQYRLFNTSLQGVTANQDFPIPFSNFQDFLSATIVYDQNGTLNAGTDISAFKLLAANTLQF